MFTSLVNISRNELNILIPPKYYFFYESEAHIDLFIHWQVRRISIIATAYE